VNVAARLESLDKDKEDPDFAGRCSRILISEGTYAIVADRFTVKEVGALSLKGKEHPVKVFRVVGKLTKKWNAHESTQSTP
jgi:class 3 adenylate cyclase